MTIVAILGMMMRVKVMMINPSDDQVTFHCNLGESVRKTGGSSEQELR